MKNAEVQPGTFLVPVMSRNYLLVYESTICPQVNVKVFTASYLGTFTLAQRCGI